MTDHNPHTTAETMYPHGMVRRYFLLTSILLLAAGCIRGGFEARLRDDAAASNADRTSKAGEAGAPDARRLDLSIPPDLAGRHDGRPPDQARPPDLAKVPDLPRPDLALCKAAELAVNVALAAINHCQQDADCTYSNGICPFGCYYLHHKGESTATVNQLVGVYKFTLGCNPCSNMCAPAGQLSCASGSCKMSLP